MHMNYQMSRRSSLVLVEMFEVPSSISNCTFHKNCGKLLNNQAKDGTNTCNENTSAIFATNVQGDSGST